MRFLRPSRTVEISLLAIRYSNCRFPMESSRAPSLMLTRIRSSESILDGPDCKLHFLLKRLAFSLQPHGQNAGRSAVWCGVAYCKKWANLHEKRAYGAGMVCGFSTPQVRPRIPRGRRPRSRRTYGRAWRTKEVEKEKDRLVTEREERPTIT